MTHFYCACCYFNDMLCIHFVGSLEYWINDWMNEWIIRILAFKTDIMNFITIYCLWWWQKLLNWIESQTMAFHNTGIMFSQSTSHFWTTTISGRCTHTHTHARAHVCVCRVCVCVCVCVCVEDCSWNTVHFGQWSYINTQTRWVMCSICVSSINSRHLALNGLPVQAKVFLSAHWELVLLWDCLCLLPQEEAPVSFWEEIPL